MNRFPNLPIIWKNVFPRAHFMIFWVLLELPNFFLDFLLYFPQQLSLFLSLIPLCSFTHNLYFLNFMFNKFTIVFIFIILLFDQINLFVHLEGFHRILFLVYLLEGLLDVLLGFCKGVCDCC